jgi:hypothetical protein
MSQEGNLDRFPLPGDVAEKSGLAAKTDGQQANTVRAPGYNKRERGAMSTVSILTHDDAVVIEVPNPRPNPGTGVLNYYFGKRGTATPGPQGFMVNFEPGLRNRAHFHHVEQFQVFFGAAGSRYQKHDIGSLMLHYVDPDMVYGPFESGSEPLRFFTLRPRGDGFIGFLPEDRVSLMKGVRRHFEIPLAAWLEAPLPENDEIDSATIVPEHDDGLAAWRIAARGGTSIDLPPTEGSAGAYLVVVDGSGTDGERELPRLSLGWYPSSNKQQTLLAGPHGVKVLYLRFPFPLAERPS